MKRRKADRRQIVADYKTSVGCADCGYNAHAEALDFDHLPGSDKHLDICGAVGRAWPRERLLAEMAKCEVVCANCHRVRTAERRARFEVAS